MLEENFLAFRMQVICSAKCEQVSMIGVHFEDNHVATGFGNHLARPILRDEWHENLSFEDGVRLLEKCMRVLLYRDRSAINKLQVSLSLSMNDLLSFHPFSMSWFFISTTSSLIFYLIFSFFRKFLRF